MSINRRDFFKGAAVVGGAAALSGIVGFADGDKASGSATASSTAASAGSAAGTVSWMPANWDDTADVIVVGFGGAGACAAIAAQDAGAKVIVLEKEPNANGGNTGCSSGIIHTAPFADADEWAEKVARGSYGTVPEDIAKAMVAHAEETPDWLNEIGLTIAWTDTENTNPLRPAKCKTGLIDGQDGAEGRFLWKALYAITQDKGIDVRLGTGATHLVQNPDTKEIIGVKAADADGKELCFKASKAVILACGGYEGNGWKQSQFNQPGVRLYPWGTPYNTGDGIDMLCEVGATLWHMHGLEFSALNFKLPSIEINCSASSDATKGIQPYNHLFVNQFGKRFMNEQKSMNHDIESKPALDFDSTAGEYANIPFYMVFDSTMFNAGPLYTGTGRSGIINTYAGVQGLCDWGSDNSQALEKGWIFQGDTLEDLAANIKGTTPQGTEVGCDGAALAETVATYNDYANAGEDPDFGRDPERMLPVDQPPYYAIELGFSCINTQGGGMRNGDCQVLDSAQNPIPRLYSAGELGSINGYVYVFGNIFEALTTGHVAGEAAAALDGWDA